MHRRARIPAEPFQDPRDLGDAGGAIDRREARVYHACERRGPAHAQRDASRARR